MRSKGPTLLDPLLVQLIDKQVFAHFQDADREGVRKSAIFAQAESEAKFAHHSALGEAQIAGRMGGDDVLEQNVVGDEGVSRTVRLFPRTFDSLPRRFYLPLWVGVV